MFMVCLFEYCTSYNIIFITHYWQMDTLTTASSHKNAVTNLAIKCGMLIFLLFPLTPLFLHLRAVCPENNSMFVVFLTNIHRKMRERMS